MGNCLQRSGRGRSGGDRCASKRAVWAEEEVSAAAEKEEVAGARKGESPPLAPAPDQVKIRITRKQLEELLRRVDDGRQDGVGGVPAWEVISELMCEASSSDDVGSSGAQGQWRPSLQSIPE